MEIPEGKSPLGRPGHKKEDSNKMELQEVEWRGIDWTDLAQDREKFWALVNAVINLRGSRKCGEFLD